MRLRYLRLPHYGPLDETEIVFGQEELLFNASNEGRKGAINFVVGVNGTGKSTVLRAIYLAFRALKTRSATPPPITMAWDRIRDGKSFTVVAHVPSNNEGVSFFAVLKPLSCSFVWTDLVATLSASQSRSTLDPFEFFEGVGAFQNSVVDAYLPENMLAYTSGNEAMWDHLDYPTSHKFEDEIVSPVYDEERPHGWNHRKEENHILHDTNIDGSMLAVNTETQRRNQKLLKNGAIDLFRINQSDIRLVGVSAAICQSASELQECATEGDIAALQRKFRLQVDNSENVDGFRRVLNEIDWFMPTHVSLVYNGTNALIDEQHCQELLGLVQLADNVIAQPCGRQRAVISLGHSLRLGYWLRLMENDTRPIFSSAFKEVAKRLVSCNSGAEALIRVFSEDKSANLNAALWDVFSRLRDWLRIGLLEDITLTFRRLNDDAYLTLDQMSDGEQMLLFRASLISLLGNQNESLLLLDEPETHFNDTWKRQLIDLVDDMVLKTTSAQVVVSTHTSFALTDVFSSEISRLVKKDGKSKAERVLCPTFGADPGRILLHVFGAPDIIGSRAAEFLRSKLDPAKWPPEDHDKLKALIDGIGSGWPRAKLMEILDGIEGADVTPGS